MYGDRLGSLKINIKPYNEKSKEIWIRKGNQQDYWRQGHTSIEEDIAYKVSASYISSFIK